MAQPKLLQASKSYEFLTGHFQISGTSKCPYPSVDKAQDNFQCTYFRNRLPKHTMKKKTLSLPDDNLASTDSSDACTDSEDELENVTNVLRWLRTLPTNPKLCEMDNEITNIYAFDLGSYVIYGRKSFIERNVHFCEALQRSDPRAKKRPKCKTENYSVSAKKLKLSA